ncbi:protein STICHEL-like 4 isoform X2 [Musa acuminata AAA Group]|uniref:protein STICHEL-like 4 isoform X2 n=1 Tax=Musa acuminata AAA Group TaxID=214697 RepID=UPI0031DEC814
MHRRSPNIARRSLMRDLIVLQKSRSLRDPSASPPSWASPYNVGGFARKSERKATTNGRWISIGDNCRREAGRLSVSLPLVRSVATAKVTAAEATGDYVFEEIDRDAEITKVEEAGIRSHKSDSLSGNQVSSKDTHKKVVGQRKREPNKSADGQAVCPKTLSEQLEEVPGQTDDFNKKKSGLFQHGRHESKRRTNNAVEENTCDHYRRSNRGKKCRLKGARRACRSIYLRGIGDYRNLTNASDSVAVASKNQKAHLENVEEDTELKAAWTQRNVCGIPWNWSRIHQQGKTFLDIAGRSLSCGLSDFRTKKAEGLVPQREGNTSNMATALDHLTPTSSDSEVLPLLTEVLEFQGNGANCLPSKGYSGELEIFSNHSLRHYTDSDLSSDARSSQKRYRLFAHGRHRSLTQKYMPKTFKDLVGQNLVVQALSNAIMRRKVGLIYVFHGPHGTGKTSCARVFARALNCLSEEVFKPCGVCSSCISNDLGRSRDVLELGPVGNFDFESIKDAFDNMMLLPRSSMYRVFILDDCDGLPSNLWSTISKVIDRSPRHVIFVLICSNLDSLPHIIISRCQKFFFPKVRDSDIISTLQWIATSEGLEIDKDALKLIASRSDGSLRDAEMTLDQISLLGKKISLPLVQELVGLVSDEKLVDLLDLSLSADTVNTVKSLREIMETGVDPLALMSQLATIITDILAGSYVFTQDRLCRKFFRRQTLSKEDMERLRKALRTLSETEKQLRASSDKLTWLTAALLQLAPDQQYMLPSSSTDRSLDHSPMLLNNSHVIDIHGGSTNKLDDMQLLDRSFSRGVGQGYNNNISGNELSHSVTMANGRGPAKPSEAIEASDLHNTGKRYDNIEKIWQAVLKHIPSDTLRWFLYNEGSLKSVSLGAAPTVQMAFSSNANKYRAEKFRGQLLQAFESVLASPVMLEISCRSRNTVRLDAPAAPLLPSSESGSSKMTVKQQYVKNKNSLNSVSENLAGKLIEENILGRICSGQARWLHPGPPVMTEDEIVEAGPHELRLTNKTVGSMEKGFENVWEEASASCHHSNLVSLSERKDNEQNQRKNLVSGQVSLAHVIQQAEGGWSRCKAMSVAEKLEQENLRLEPRSRSLFCWKVHRTTRAKCLNMKIRRKPQSLSKLIICGRCLHTASPK